MSESTNEGQPAHVRAWPGGMLTAVVDTGSDKFGCTSVPDAHFSCDDSTVQKKLGQKKPECLKWSSWTNWLSMGDGVLEAALGFFAGDAKIVASLYAVHDGITGVMTQFNRGICDMLSGTAITFDFPPSSKHAWPSAADLASANRTSGKKGVAAIIDGTWQVMKGSLNELAAKIPTDSPKGDTFRAVLTGLLNAGDSMVDDLRQGFDQVDA